MVFLVGFKMTELTVEWNWVGFVVNENVSQNDLFDAKMKKVGLNWTEENRRTDYLSEYSYESVK